VNVPVIRDALDRTLLIARTAVEVQVGPPKPHEMLLERIHAGSRAEYVGRHDASGIEDSTALMDQLRSANAHHDRVGADGRRPFPVTFDMPVDVAGLSQHMPGSLALESQPSPSLRSLATNKGRRRYPELARRAVLNRRW
jgi:hypothetical protein